MACTGRRYDSGTGQSRAGLGSWPVAFDAGPSQTLLCSCVHFACGATLRNGTGPARVGQQWRAIGARCNGWIERLRSPQARGVTRLRPGKPLVTDKRHRTMCWIIEFRLVRQPANKSADAIRRRLSKMSYIIRYSLHRERSSQASRGLQPPRMPTVETRRRITIGLDLEYCRRAVAVRPSDSLSTLSQRTRRNRKYPPLLLTYSFKFRSAFQPTFFLSRLVNNFSQVLPWTLTDNLDHWTWPR